ncbi:hypothetical protein ACRALDRAFT_207853 [Sodiomyces alcalophilus JCM 7366]|uniref:uncharacterized protein n=1 Tax=Sodiomyces alcalophilus JCM 7366 TaxID=591952 RepID=UPI0039B66394
MSLQTLTLIESPSRRQVSHESQSDTRIRLDQVFEIASLSSIEEEMFRKLGPAEKGKSEELNKDNMFIRKPPLLSRTRPRMVFHVLRMLSCLDMVPDESTPSMMMTLRW